MKQRIEIPELVDCVTIDVGKNTALAFWDGTFFPSIQEIKYSGRVKGKPERYIEIMTNSLYDLLDGYRKWFTFIQIEGVGLWEKSSRSLTSASRGDLFTVAYLVGAYTVVAQEFSIDVRIVNAPQWKGQLTKEGTAARVKRINGKTYKNDHITDAVAMGFSNVKEIWHLERTS